LHIIAANSITVKRQGERAAKRVGRKGRREEKSRMG
jgi:hypothetical protein